MYRRFSYAATVFLLIATAPAMAQDIARAVEDARITARIETMFLLNESLSSFNINTNTNDGVVSISGSVSNPVEKDLAQELAESVPGVKRVENNIVVMDMPVPQEPKRDWKQIVQDRTTSASLRSRLLYHKQFQGLSIDVKVRNGNVTLSGVVGNEAAKEAIGRIASETRGVESVDNNLVVKSREQTDPMNTVVRRVSDEWVEKRVETAILLNRHIAIGDLNVEMRDGVCILTGTVTTDAQKELAGSVTASVSGVRDLQNDIEVKELMLDLEPLEISPEMPESP